MIIIPLLTLTVILLTSIYWVIARRPREKIIMVAHNGTVVKSVKAEPLGIVDGTVRDRSFVVRTEKGSMVTANMIPSLVLIQSSIEDNILTLKFPGAKDLTVDVTQVKENNKEMTLDIWGHPGSGLDCGEDSSRWLETILGCKCYLLYHGDLPSSRMTEEEDCPLMRNDDNPLYANLTSYMLMTTESIADLQSRLECKVDEDNFRPNILIDGTKEPYDEDDWEYVMIGDAVYRNVKPCERCILTTVDPKTGKKDRNQEPLRTLKTYRCLGKPNEPHLGIHLGLDLAGVMREGDEVFVTRSAKTKKR
ncbi:Mitochondrial amidoxime-reducing component 1-like 1 [Homarus americanus]|uniref:Mitochondrial amidoxime-reducing component 1-like 1 n=1 Tax=Homarus americanus TaxID=6706 RepID=A0A8J5NEB4_HOMAM|nr:Mitochondrial amidoxime-reducing component 1-like 1 [Homarus americanus]